MAIEVSNEIAVSRRRATTLRDSALVGTMLVATGLGAVLSLPQAQAGQARPFALVFPPWISRQDAVARSFAAGHEVLRSGVASFIVIAAPQGEGGAAVAKPEGAMLMLALDGLAGCLDSGTATEAPP